jgi:hypothetical protein
MRLLSNITVAVAAVVAATATGVIPAAQAGLREDTPWVHIGSYFSKSDCERDWRENYAKRWKKHLCTQAARHVYWDLYVR